MRGEYKTNTPSKIFNTVSLRQCPLLGVVMDTVVSWHKVRVACVFTDSNGYYCGRHIRPRGATPPPPPPCAPTLVFDHSYTPDDPASVGTACARELTGAFGVGTVRSGMSIIQPMPPSSRAAAASAAILRAVSKLRPDVRGESAASAASAAIRWDVIMLRADSRGAPPPPVSTEALVDPKPESDSPSSAGSLVVYMKFGCPSGHFLPKNTAAHFLHQRCLPFSSASSCASLLAPPLDAAGCRSAAAVRPRFTVCSSVADEATGREATVVAAVYGSLVVYMKLACPAGHVNAEN